VALLGAAMVLLAAALGVPELYVPGVTLALIAVAAAGSVVLAAAPARVTREPRVAVIQEGESLQLHLRIHAPLPARGELSAWPGAPLRPVPRGRDASLELTARAQRRGAHAIGPARVRFRDPFGIAARTRSSPASEVLVLPRVEAVRTRELARMGALGRAARGLIEDAGGSDVDGLRPYRHGAPASRIHWPTVARTRTLVERRMHDRSAGIPLIVLDSSAPASVEHLDRAVRAAASLCVGLARLGGCGLLLPGARRADWLGRDLAGWQELHARLALVEPDEPLLQRAWANGSALVWVSASTWPPGPPSHPLGGCELRYLVSPLHRGAAQALFEVGGCAVMPARLATHPSGPAPLHTERAA
jgi:uncharacterized protein (DUF58 family)